jgi:hypothetical protein
MTYKQIVDRFTANVQAGIKTDESRFTREFISSHVNSVRATAIQQSWQKMRRINPQWLQEYELEYSGELQYDLDSTCVTKYYVPGWIHLDGKTDGMVFVGNNENRNFRIFNTRSELATYLSLSSQSPYTGRYVGVLRDNGFIEIHYNTRIKAAKILMLYNDPLECPTFNVEFDPYPATEDLIVVMEDLLIRKLSAMAQQPIDMVPNKNDVRVGQAQPYRQQS